MSRPLTILAILATAVACTLLPSTAEARSSIYTDWEATYPGSASGPNMVAGDGKSCALCHEDSGGGGSFNGYGWAMRDRLNAGDTNFQAFAAIENMDSDGEGNTNLEEINADAQPGWTAGSNTIYFKNGSTGSGPAPSVTPLDPGAPVDNPPVANAGPNQSVNTGDTVTFNGTGSTDDNGIVSYEWDVDGDSNYDYFTATANHTYTFASTYTVTLRVSDGVNAPVTDTMTVTVTTVVDNPPVANAGSDQSVYENDTVFFDGSGSSDDNGIVSYSWNFGDGGTGSGVNASHAYTTGGNYTVTLTVDDGVNAPQSDTALVTVSAFVDNPPVANAGPDKSATVGNAVSFDGSGSSDDIGIVSYSWTFGDGGTGSGVSASHTYSAVGNYTVTLTVSDGVNAPQADTAFVTVSAMAMDAEVVSLVTDFASYTAGSAVTATATVVNNSGGTLANVFVDFVYKDGSGVAVFSEAVKIKRMNSGQTKSAASSYAPGAAGNWTVEATSRWDVNTYNTLTTGFVVTPGQASVMHVDSIGFATRTKGRTETLTTTVRIVDASSLAPISGATVSGTLTLPSGSTVNFSDLTVADGTVAFGYSVKNQTLAAGNYTFTVTAVAKAGSTYDGIGMTDTFVK